MVVRISHLLSVAMNFLQYQCATRGMICLDTDCPMCSSRLISSQSRLHYEALAQKWGSLFTVFLPGVILQL
jgi:transposase